MDALSRLTPMSTAIGITSFNEWHEGSQIEPARTIGGGGDSRSQYLNYQPFSADYYLRLTRVFVNLFAGLRRLPAAFWQVDVSEREALRAFNMTLFRRRDVAG